jgi:cytoskeleton protein RodZ
MDALGSDLKKAREASGLSLREVATRTKISVTALEALERNDPSRLPGGIFGRSFVRAYATEVGLDPEQTVERFLALLERDEEERAERRRASRPAISEDDQRFLDRQQRALLVARVVAVIVLAALVALVVWGVRILWPLRDAPTEAEVTATMPLPPGVELPKATPDATAEAPASAAAAGLVIELAAVTDMTIVTAVDGQAESNRPLRTGETMRIEAAREVLLDVSNAAGVAVSINGRRIKPLGGAGARARVRITPDNAGQF